jgi:hypothetical protein
MEINLKKLQKLQLFVEDYLFLQMIFEDINPLDFNWVNSPRITQLESEDYIKVIGSQIIARQKTIDLFKNTEIDCSWIEEFRNLWPPGVNSTGQAWKGDKQDCIKKMRNFIKTNKYTKEVIIEAGKNYLNFTNNSPFRMTCSNFIHKQDKGSTLLAWCQNRQKENNFSLNEMS